MNHEIDLGHKCPTTSSRYLISALNTNIRRNLLLPANHGPENTRLIEDMKMTVDGLQLTGENLQHYAYSCPKL